MLRFGRIPRKGERWKGRFADFVIEDATPTAIRKVRMILPPPPEKQGAAMSPTRTVTLIRGDGIGPEVADAVVSILAAAGAPLVVRGGRRRPRGREARRRPPSRRRRSRRSARTRVALKGPVGTPIGKGFQSVNVRLRQALELYANLRPVRNVPGVESRFQGVDLVIVRENTEDLYSGLEHTSFPASSSRSRSSPRSPRRGSPASPSSTRAPTAGAASRRSTRRTS